MAGMIDVVNNVADALCDTKVQEVHPGLYEAAMFMPSFTNQALLATYGHLLSDKVLLAHRISDTGESTTHQRYRPRLSLSDHTLWLEVEEGRKNIAHTHGTSNSVGRSSAEMAKLNSLSLLSYSGKLYIHLYLSSPSTAAMLLQ